MPVPTCETCAYWRPPVEADTGPGECRRRSPRAIYVHRTDSWHSKWPATWHLDFCGEHRPADETGEVVERP
jgi:hypothetical protein